MSGLSNLGVTINNPVVVQRRQKRIPVDVSNKLAFVELACSGTEPAYLRAIEGVDITAGDAPLGDLNPPPFIGGGDSSPLMINIYVSHDTGSYTIIVIIKPYVREP